MDLETGECLDCGDIFCGPVFKCFDCGHEACDSCHHHGLHRDMSDTFFDPDREDDDE